MPTSLRSPAVSVRIVWGGAQNSDRERATQQHPAGNKKNMRQQDLSSWTEAWSQQLNNAHSHPDWLGSANVLQVPAWLSSSTQSTLDFEELSLRTPGLHFLKLWDLNEAIVLYLDPCAFRMHSQFVWLFSLGLHCLGFKGSWQSSEKAPKVGRMGHRCEPQSCREAARLTARLGDELSKDEFMRGSRSGLQGVTCYKI